MIFMFLEGVDFQVKSIKVFQEWVALQLWDTAGQERYILYFHSRVQCLVFQRFEKFYILPDAFAFKHSSDFPHFEKEIC